MNESLTMSKFHLIIFLIIISLLTSACSSAQPTPTETAIPEIIPSPTPIDEAISILTPGYPSPIISARTIVPAYPAPTEPNVTPSQIPTQDQSKGSLTGRLLLNNQPVSDVIMSLAGVIRDDSGREMVVSYDPSSSPTATTDSQGYFVFFNVHPGKYGLILDMIIKSYLLHYPDEEDSQILITIDQGEEFDLGDLNYDSLPIQTP